VNLAPLEELSAVFSALADPQRRAVLRELAASGGQSASRLARGMTISRQAIVKHLDQLDRADLVSARKQGRELVYIARPAQLERAGHALQAIAADWDNKLELLKQIAEEGRSEL
jgi:DNA-binding transcriptional ArsR family regulator